MEDTVDMEVMVMEKGPLKQMLNLVITEEAMVATVMEAMAEDMDTMVNLSFIKFMISSFKLFMIGQETNVLKI